MKQHERELLVYTIRSGNVYIQKNDLRLVVKPLSIEQSVEACISYQQSYERAMSDGIMSEEDMLNWMLEHELWMPYDDKKVESFKSDIERLKIEIYNARNDRKLKEKIRLYIRSAEHNLISYTGKKNLYMQNTCEGIAASDKICWIIKNTTFCNEKLYDFSDVSVEYVIDEWQTSFLSDKDCRELARNEPWKSLWTIRENGKIKLFLNQDCELTYNQKNLLIWSQMYENIQESLECPSKEVIEDDDMLDGWFIIQNKKREKEAAEKEIESLVKNEKIKSASEVFVIAKDKDHINTINSANSSHANIIKKQREEYIKMVGSTEDHNLPDQRLQIRATQTNMMRDHIRGGK